MKYRINRRTGDRISEIGIGSSYMYEAGREEAVKALRRAFEGGINYFDLNLSGTRSFIRSISVPITQKATTAGRLILKLSKLLSQRC